MEYSYATCQDCTHVPLYHIHKITHFLSVQSQFKNGWGNVRRSVAEQLIVGSSPDRLDGTILWNWVQDIDISLSKP